METVNHTEMLWQRGQDNYRRLCGLCRQLEQNGYWQQAQKVMKQSVFQTLDLYVQSHLVCLADRIRPLSGEQQKFLQMITRTNPLAVGESGQEPGVEATQAARRIAGMPPILIQLCGVRDTQENAGHALDFFTSVFRILCCFWYLSAERKQEGRVYLQEYYQEVSPFVVTAQEDPAAWCRWQEAAISGGKQVDGHADAEVETAWTQTVDADNVRMETEQKQGNGQAGADEETAGKPSAGSDRECTKKAQKQTADEDAGMVWKPLVDAHDARAEIQHKPVIGQVESDAGKLRKPVAAEKDAADLAQTRSVLQEEALTQTAEDGEARKLREQRERLVARQAQIRQERKRLEEEQRAARKEFEKVKRRIQEREKAEREAQEKRLAALLDELNGLVGLAAVKKEIHSLVNLIKVRRMREKMKLPAMEMSYHMVFTGNPGTGKTTVARLVAKIYREMGILSGGQLVETDRSRLVAGYVGQTAINVREIVEQAIGGVLFIDEAYALVSPDAANDYGSEAVDTLVKMMEDHRENLVVIVAGYPEEMKKFLRSNTGLISRFNKFISFEDYTRQQLLEILQGMAVKAGFSVEAAAVSKLDRQLREMTPQQQRDFGNARGVRNLFERMTVNQANRLVQMEAPTREDLMTLTAADA